MIAATRRAPMATPTPIPAWAPVDSPEFCSLELALSVLLVPDVDEAEVSAPRGVFDEEGVVLAVTDASHDDSFVSSQAGAEAGVKSDRSEVCHSIPN